MSEPAVSETPDTESQQTSVEPEPTAQDDLDSLLNEYQAEPETPVTQPAQPEVSDEERAEFRQMLNQQREVNLNEALNDSAGMVKKAAGEVAANIPDWMFIGALREESTRNPNLEKVFEGRASNPDAWNKVAAALGKKIAQDLTPVDQQSTNSWGAVESAVHSASTSNPTKAETVTEKDLKGMSDQEFQQYRQQNGF